jgi:hypothetical protein
MKNVDIIIVGGGIAGLYSAYTIKQLSPDSSFMILEKQSKKYMGGRTGNDVFYGTNIVTGAGVGRKNKDKLLYKLLRSFGFDINEYIFHPYKSNKIEDIDINGLIDKLRNEYKPYMDKKMTFKQYATHILGKKTYMDFIQSVGYTDYEKEDVLETLYYYGIEDNTSNWKAFSVPWKKLVTKLYEDIGENHFRFSNKVTSITRIDNNSRSNTFIVNTENGVQYMCNKVIVATTIVGIRTLLKNDIYNDIEGQPFLRMYAKFDKKSIPILKEYVKGFTILPSPLQKMIPIDPNNGVYMISYSDNNNALTLKNHLENTEYNRYLYTGLLEGSLGIPENSLHIIAIKDYYWNIGTHYYKPLNTDIYIDREDFIHKAQNPEHGIVVVGEVVSRNQGWVEGALQSVKKVITRKWLMHL